MYFVGVVSFMSSLLACFELHFPEMRDAAVPLLFHSLLPSLLCLLLTKYSRKPFLLTGLCLAVDCKLPPEVFLWFKQIQGLSTMWIYSYQIPQNPYSR